MRSWLGFLALLGLGLASPAGAEDVAIRLGETVTIAVDGQSGVRIVQRSQHPNLSRMDREAGRQLADGDHPEAVGPNAVGFTAEDLGGRGVDPVRPDVVRISFVTSDGHQDHAFLVIENGYEGALNYRATMRRGDRAATTDVCQVMPQRRGYEHWPFPIEELILSDFRLTPWQESDGIRCE